MVEQFVPREFISTRYNVRWINTVMIILSRKKRQLCRKARESHGNTGSSNIGFNTGMKQARDYFLESIISSHFDYNDNFVIVIKDHVREITTFLNCAVCFNQCALIWLLLFSPIRLIEYTMYAAICTIWLFGYIGWHRLIALAFHSLNNDK